MIKITDLTEVRFRTTHKKDRAGNRIKGREEYVAKRAVKSTRGGLRFVHYIVDFICIRIIIYVIDLIMSVILLTQEDMQSPETIIGIFFAGLFLQMLVYPLFYFFFEYKWQRTPAKFLTKSIVINEYGEKPDLRQCALRSLIRIVPFEAFSFLGDDNRGWHDRWSDTWVVSAEELQTLKRLQQEQAEKQQQLSPSV